MCYCRDNAVIRADTNRNEAIKIITNANIINETSCVVDFGCGMGRMSKAIIDTFNCEVIGVDINFSDGQGNMSDHIISLNINGTNNQIVRNECTSNGTLFTDITHSWIGVKNLTASDAVKINVFIDTNDSSTSEIRAIDNFQNQFWGVLIN